MTARIDGHRRQSGEDDSDGELVADGLMARIVERIVDNPAMSGGLMVMALTAAAVVSNAVFLQRALHPEPWFMTRPAPVATAPGASDVVVPDPRPRAGPRVMPPEPRVQPAAAPKPAAPSPAPTLIADLQRALSERGYYRGKIDGISGSRTRAAITAYEKAEGLPVTGQPSDAVLDHITTASLVAAKPATAGNTPQPVTVAAAPAATPSAALEMPPAAKPVAAALPAPNESPPAVEELLSYPPSSAGPVAPSPAVVEPQAPTATATATANPPQASLQDIGSQRTLSVQRALNLIGYGPVPEDGIAGEATTGAIRRFELDHGLPITGAAGDTVIDRLVAIGAMDAA
ncbi:MAG TPA: peptidoglycan-binding domain-containing protein [Bauldia sp.]|nr:peptidoglycan-binding domain-containing protein [Bauldia sp.]